MDSLNELKLVLVRVKLLEDELRMDGSGAMVEFCVSIRTALERIIKKEMP